MVIATLVLIGYSFHQCSTMMLVIDGRGNYYDERQSATDNRHAWTSTRANDPERPRPDGRARRGGHLVLPGDRALRRAPRLDLSPLSGRQGPADRKSDPLRGRSRRQAVDRCDGRA